MLDPYTDFQFILQFLENRILAPDTDRTIDTQNYALTLRTVNRKKKKEFGLTVRLIKAEQLNNAKDYRWHWYEWRQRRGVLVYSVEFLSKRLFRLRELLYERCVFKNNCFNKARSICLSVLVFNI